MDTLLIDVDGVILDWNLGFELWMKERGYKKKVESTYDLSDAYEMDKTEIHTLGYEYCHSEDFARIPAFRDAPFYLDRIAVKFELYIHAISAVYDDKKSYAARWSNIKHFYPTDFWTLTHTITSENKLQHLLKYKDSGCFWIEDHMPNALMGLECGLRPILMDHPYNRDENHPDIPRVSSWKEIYTIIKSDCTG